jgi:hypothetical protein
MVTHSSTSRPVQCLCMAERTGCPVLTDLWSYVPCHHNLVIYPSIDSGPIQICLGADFEGRNLKFSLSCGRHPSPPVSCSQFHQSATKSCMLVDSLIGPTYAASSCSHANIWSVSGCADLDSGFACVLTLSVGCSNGYVQRTNTERATATEHI